MCTMYVSSIFKHLLNWNPSGPMETNETSKEVTGWLVKSQDRNRSLRKNLVFLGSWCWFCQWFAVFQKKKKDSTKKSWQKADSLLWHRKLLDLLVCFHLSKWKRRLNNSIVNVDFCFHLSSTVMSCHHAAPLVRKKTHATCLVGFLQEADEVTQEQQSRGGSRTRETMGETLGTSVSIKGDVWYVSWVWPFCQDAIVAK